MTSTKAVDQLYDPPTVPAVGVETRGVLSLSDAYGT
jgi:hypothetical protein